MPRKKTARRFVPRYPVVSQSVIDEEAKWLAREVDDYLVLSANEVRKFTDERYDLATKSWKALQQAIASLPERDAEAVRAVLFRDIFHTLECCRSFIRSHTPEGVKRIIPDEKAVERQEQFNEWLFHIERKEE